MNWICPKCDGIDPGCSICDGGSFITDQEMHCYLLSVGFRLKEPTQKQIEQPILVLDLSEFEGEQSHDNESH